MDLYRIIHDLMEERNRLDRIIRSLEAVGEGEVPAKALRGRRRGRKFMDAAARQEVSERMKRYWAQRRAQKAPQTASGSV